jgi:hypothetical protein
MHPNNEFNLLEWQVEQSHYIKRAVRLRLKSLALVYSAVLMPLMLIITILILISFSRATLKLLLILLYVVLPLVLGLLTVAGFIFLAIIAFKGVFIITKITNKGIYQYARYSHNWQKYLMLAPKHIFVPWNEIKHHKAIPDLHSVDLVYKKRFTLKDRIPHIIANEKSFEEVKKIFNQHSEHR